MCLEFEDYTKAFSIDIKRYKKNYWATENRIISRGYFFVKQALQNKNAKDASGVLDLLLAEMDFAQTTTTANLCHSEENIFPELLVVAADIFSLKKQHAESPRCLDKALYILRYVKTHNFVESLFPRKTTVKEILEKKASTIY